MAKQKNITEEQAPQAGADTFQGTESDTGATNPPEPKPEDTPAPEKGEKKPVAAEADSYTLEVLKSFPTHESLYVDRQGGAFTSDTPKAIRGSAVLYKNPFYKR